jgi:uncharacterized protein YfaS (alpha-2-macroglobulin family)
MCIPSFFSRFLWALFLLLGFHRISAQNTLTRISLRIDSLTELGLPKSALVEVDKLEAWAKVHKNVAQEIKATIYRMNFTSFLGNDSFDLVIQKIKQDIRKASFPVKPVLQSLLAEVYFKYYQNNRYKISQRTRLLKPDSDYKNWDIETLIQETGSLYALSLWEDIREQDAPTGILEGVLDGDPSTRYLRPSLYDILVQRALDFYLSDEPEITRPKQGFDLNDPKFFAGAEIFSKLKIQTTDSLSPHYRGLLYLQKALNFHLKNPKEEALADLDLKRIQFIYAHSQVENKDSLYRRFLNQLTEEYKDKPISTEALYFLGKYYKDQDSLILAHVYFEKAKKAFPKSLGGINSENSIKELEQGFLALRVEDIQVPKKPLLASLEYMNLGEASLILYQLNKEQTKIFNEIPWSRLDRSKLRLNYLNKLKVNRQKDLHWDPIQDYKKHNFEFSLDSFLNGHYVFLIKGGKEGDTSLMSFGEFDVTQISYTHRIDPKGETEIRVMDRESGKPLYGVQIHLEGRKERNNQFSEIQEDGKTNIEGQYITQKFKEETNNFYLLEFKYGGDEFKVYSPYNAGSVLDEDSSFENKDLIFTDRQIYRPGQTLYFKVLKYAYYKEITKLLVQDTLTVRLKDVNGKEIAKMKSKTNAFGTFSGKFTIPMNVLPGNFSLETDDGDLDIRVEEYKRPSIRLEVLPISKTYKLGDSVKMEGKVNAYSGYGVSQNRIHYHITRSRNLKWDSRTMNFIYNPSNSDKEAEISSGDIYSNDLGAFTLFFKASPDSSDEKPYSNYTYNLSLEATDGSGETQTINSSIVVGPSDIKLFCSLPDFLRVKDTFNTSIRINNVNDQPIVGTVQIHIWRLKKGNTVYKNRLWSKPDQEYLNKADFNKDFPDYAYRNDDEKDYWEKTPIPLDQKFVVPSSSPGILNLNSLRKENPGLYKIQILAKNLQGDTLSRNYYVKLVEDQIMVTDISDWEIPIVNSVKSGEETEFQIGIHRPINVLVEEMDGPRMISSHWIHLDSGVKRLKFPITKDIKEPAIQFLMVYKNRYFFKRENIFLIQPDTRLKIQMISFRDKMEPGSKEIWKMQVTNSREGPKPNEVLAGLYDASLDALSPSVDWKENITWGQPKNENYFEWGNQKWSDISTSEPLKYLFNGFSILKREYETIDLMGYDYFGGYNSEFNSYWAYRNIRKEVLRENQIKVEAFKKEYYNQIKKPHSGFWVFGWVRDYQNKIPIELAEIKGKYFRIKADRGGFFKIKMDKETSLEVGAIGYSGQKFNIRKDQFLSVFLKSHSQNLNDLVVTGYSSVKKKDLTGAISSIRIRGLSNIYGSRAPSPSGLPEDTVPGLQITTNTKKFTPPVLKYDMEVIKKEALANQASFLGIQKPIIFRKNFNETAFFYPQLRTDDRGELKLEFTMPDALTEWKFRILSHNQNMQWGYFETKVVTQKSFSIEANMPRFLREGDTLRVSARLSNLSDKKVRGKVHLSLFNAVNMNPVQLLLNARDSLQDFELDAQTNKPVSFSWVIPKELEGITYRLSAESGNYSDGEENTLPVLSNRIWVTETLPMMVRSGQTQNYTLDKLFNNTSTTLENKSLSLEYTQNPAWYALLSMPYLMEFPHECSEQLFSRFFANSLATQLMNHNLLIKKAFDGWKSAGSEALNSNLERNPELKSTVLEETPWLKEAGTEAERKKRLYQLFDLNKMSAELKTNLDKLKERQLISGGFTWFGGDYPDRYITEHILRGIGQLEHLGIETGLYPDLITIKRKALAYLDSELERDYKEFHQEKQGTYFHTMDLYSWYVRSFFTSVPISPILKVYLSEYLNEMDHSGFKQSLYNQGLIAFIFLRYSKAEMAGKMIQSLIEKSQDTQEMGMFWAENRSGYYWYESPVETQALMIELFTEEGHHSKLVEEMKIWLLRNKQTENWSNTKATSEAIYALLLKQDSWLSDSSGSVIHLGAKSLSELKPDLKKEIGTGYFKTSWTGSEIHPEMAQVKIENQGKSIAWGGLYWQYLENLDKITPSKTDIILTRKYFIQKNSDRGLVLTEIDAHHLPKVGDMLKVVVYLKSGRDYEYVQLKDMRPAGTEPIGTLSEYKYQDGLYYYQATRDIATNFFLSELPKGNYVFEYGLRVSQPGNFSTGISSIQCMYAPEFTAHSEGKRIVFQP